MGSLSFRGVWFSVYSDDHTPAHVHGEYGEEEDLLLMVLKSGRRVAVPVEDLQGLAAADRSLVAKLELDGLYGSFLHWEELDLDCSVLGLADGRYGSERWMAGLAQRQRERVQKAS